MQVSFIEKFRYKKLQNLSYKSFESFRSKFFLFNKTNRKTKKYVSLCCMNQERSKFSGFKFFGNYFRLKGFIFSHDLTRMLRVICGTNHSNFKFIFLVGINTKILFSILIIVLLLKVQDVFTFHQVKQYLEKLRIKLPSV
ncbi:hypothetical protein BpHYR1_028772 [Brachionus plicatilis]|uniref:Uncharacterized protein n=1 Tax=Brachionus plicatilis TaxID=10195 RepID=A0A3M7RS85_BRAPC|nr:hypothetical protein BpHYR1_028772 [Brachionus plicatilis]